MAMRQHKNDLRDCNHIGMSFVLTNFIQISQENQYAQICLRRCQRLHRFKLFHRGTLKSLTRKLQAVW